MTYALPFLRLVASGSLYAAERFSYSITLAAPSSVIPQYGAPTEVPEGVITAFTAFHNGNWFASACVLDTLKLNAIGTDGRYMGDETVMHELVAPADGGGSAGHPPQVSLAVTLRAEKSRGLASRGRFYLPGPATPLQADGRITAADALAWADRVAVLLNDINTALPDWHPGIVSNVGAGVQEYVKYVEVGRVYDTIRSRRTSLDEDRQRTLTAITGA